MIKSNFAQKVVEWYNDHHRRLPWRETRNPYEIWISEIILQQTRVAQGLPYYERFVKRFPDVFALAGAREHEVLRLWQGLGYYTRARNLHRCAKIVVNQHAGQFPDNYKDLLKLPGIGAYTAAAIASISFGEAVAVVDGNVYRVLARIFGIEKETTSREGKNYFVGKANELISRDQPDRFNQAIMEFGATHCLPRNPKCEDCIFKRQCIAFANDLQDLLPVKNKKSKIRTRYFYYFVIGQNKKWLMQRRAGKDIWQGLYDFYLVETKKQQKPERLSKEDPVLKILGGKIEWKNISIQYKHVLSHQNIFARFIPVSFSSCRALRAVLKSKKMKLYSSKEINKLPKPTLIARYLLENAFL